MEGKGWLTRGLKSVFYVAMRFVFRRIKQTVSGAISLYL